MTKVLSAWTSMPNDTFSDLQEFVSHDVLIERDGKEETITISATDPSDAINKAKRMLGLR